MSSLFTTEETVCRGERTGELVCHTCDDNEQGFCGKYHKWCSAVRHICENQKKADKGEEKEDIHSYTGDPEKDKVIKMVMDTYNRTHPQGEVKIEDTKVEDNNDTGNRQGKRRANEVL